MELCYCMCCNKYTVNVYIFVLYIFSRNSHFIDIRENMCIEKIGLNEFCLFS